MHPCQLMPPGETMQSRSSTTSSSTSARASPDKVALVAAKQRITYAELDARSNALANALVSAAS